MTMKIQKIPVPERVPAELLLRHSMPAQGWQLAVPQPILRVGGMSPRSPTRREFLIGAGAMLVLAPYGCGSEESGHGGETTASGTRTVRDAFDRRVEVPQRASRVAVSNVNTLGDPLIALGVEPHAAPQENVIRTADYAMIPEGALEEAESIGEPGSLNLEALAAAAPDLILLDNYTADQVGVETFAEIAPTVAVDTSPGVDMWRNVTLIAEAVGVPERVAEARAEYDRAADAVKAVTDGQSVAFVRPFPDRLVTFHEDSQLGPTFADAGLTLAPPPPGAEADEVGLIGDLSVEQVPELEGDFMLVYMLDISEEQFREEYLSMPLWQSNPMIADGRFRLVAGDELSVFHAPLAAQLTFETLREIFAGGETTGGGSTMSGGETTRPSS